MDNFGIFLGHDGSFCSWYLQSKYWFSLDLISSIYLYSYHVLSLFLSHHLFSFLSPH